MMETSSSSIFFLYETPRIKTFKFFDFKFDSIFFTIHFGIDLFILPAIEINFGT